MTPRVSVVVPVRDRRALLRRCLDALAAQTVDDYEVIVIDDGSRDGSADEAWADAAAGRPVRLIEGDGRGAVAARTLGVASARGDVLAFTDSDCEPESGWLAAGLRAIEEGADVVQGATLPTRPPRPGERTIWLEREDGLFATCNVFYRRGAFDDAGGFDQAAGDRLAFRTGAKLRGLGFGEDSLLGWRVRHAGGTVVFAGDAVVRHAVFACDPPESLRRAWSAGGFPGLVAELPELRPLLLRRGLALGSWRRVPLYGAGALAVAGQWRLAGAVAVGWAAWRGRAVAQREPSWRQRAIVVPLDIACETVTAAALALGSARARRLVV